jgi:hypothetical protein
MTKVRIEYLERRSILRYITCFENAGILDRYNNLVVNAFRNLLESEPFSGLE